MTRDLSKNKFVMRENSSNSAMIREIIAQLDAGFAYDGGGGWGGLLSLNTLKLYVKTENQRAVFERNWPT